jgi:hypothetical protein
MARRGKMRTVQIARNRYDSQADDKLNDLKMSPTAPGRLHGFTASAGLERSAA